MSDNYESIFKEEYQDIVEALKKEAPFRSPVWEKRMFNGFICERLVELHYGVKFIDLTFEHGKNYKYPDMLPCGIYCGVKKISWSGTIFCNDDDLNTPQLVVHLQRPTTTGDYAARIYLLTPADMAQLNVLRVDGGRKELEIKFNRLKSAPYTKDELDDVCIDWMFEDYPPKDTHVAKTLGHKPGFNDCPFTAEDIGIIKPVKPKEPEETYPFPSWDINC